MTSSGCRRPSELESTLSKCRPSEPTVGSYECLELDLMSLQSVRKFADVIIKKNIPIHVLVNNGGSVPQISNNFIDISVFRFIVNAM